MQVTHSFVSTKTDGSDSSLVRPSSWNANHVVEALADGIVLGVPAGAGANQPIQELPITSLAPAGVIMAYGGTAVPAGWLLCDGTSYLRTTYPTLFTAIGVNFGSADGTHFNVPDMRGHVAVGLGGTLGWILGQIGGSMTRQPRVHGYVDVLAAALGAAMSGVLPGSASAGAGSGAGSNFTFAGEVVNVSGDVLVNNNNAVYNYTSSLIHDDGANVTDQFDVIQPGIGLNYIIKT
jgi:microcystin-dependent protein